MHFSKTAPYAPDELLGLLGMSQARKERAWSSLGRPQMTKQPKADAATPPLLPYLTIKQFASHYGLSDTTIRRRVRDGSLPSVQAGGKGKKILIPSNALTGNTVLNRHADPSVTPVAAAPVVNVKPAARRGPRPRWRNENSTQSS